MKTASLSVRLLLLLAVLSSVSCSVLVTRRITFERHPIAVQVVSRVNEEAEVVEYFVRFRNVGTQILTFDYTIADEEGVVHVDSEGPHSGLIENLYPGVEVEVPNPTESMSVWVTLGTVTYGKQTPFERENVYRPDSAILKDPAQRLNESILEEPVGGG